MTLERIKQLAGLNENIQQNLGMNNEPVAEIKTGDDVKETDMPQQVKLAGDSIWDTGYPNPDMVTVTNVHKFKDDEGYVEVTVDLSLIHI